ncbi:hypothetical protein [Winogradskyella sp.]|uniref:hypothetical protein n=1 Tax=Winogradskyella sp. TaxID=1883156 RepID=UPI0026345D89|nr:hypothetical protein [Winogradskyella sp.]
MGNLLSTLKLKSQSIEDLRILLNDLNILLFEDSEGKSKSELITLIEEKLSKNKTLKSRIDNLNYSFKPSFYLTFIKDKSSYSQDLVTKRKIESKLKLLNQEKDTERYPAIRSYQLFEVNKTKDIIELHFLWHKIHWYWNTNYKLANIYELNYGLALIDLKSNKAILSCHTKKERDDLFRVIKDAIKIELNALHLTKPLLNQIGSFDSVKRAQYFVNSNEIQLPQNITLGDDNLSTKQIAREQEENIDATRKESFYRIPLRGIEEQGLGVTSETGKLWIPQKVTISEIRDFSLKLLTKVANELDALAADGQFEKIINSLGIKSSKEITSIANISVRNEIFRLFIAITNMLLNKESEKSFTPGHIILSQAINKYFNPFYLVIEGEIGEYFFGEYDNQFKLKLEPDGSYELISFISDKKVSQIVNKETGDVIEIDEALDKAILTPTPKLIEILLSLTKSLISQYPDLQNVISLPFRIESNLIKLDINRAYGNVQTNFVTEINPLEINELKQILRKKYSYNLPDNILHLLGEKCDNMSDSNCSKCIMSNEFVCLRTLVGRTLKRPVLLPHKNIEISDLQGEYGVGNQQLKLFVFAKLGSGNAGLTARNKNGAVLLGQILNQIDKSEFNTVAILTSSTINEDLLSRFRLLCSTYNKKLLILNTEALEQMLGQWIDDMHIDGLDPKEIIKNSGKVLKREMNKYLK